MRQHPADVDDDDLQLSPSRKTRFSSQPVDLAANFPPGRARGDILRSSVLRMICGSRLPIRPPGGGNKTRKRVTRRSWPIRATSLHRVEGRCGSRGLIYPWPHSPLSPRTRQGQANGNAAGDPPPRNVVAPGCRTGRGTVHPGQDADLLKGADRLVHRAPGTAGGLGAFSWWRIRARATIITRTLTLRSSGMRRPEPKNFSAGRCLAVT